VDTAPDAPHPWDTSLVRSIFVLVSLGTVLALAWFCWRRPRRARELASDPARAANRWTRDFYIMASLADTLAFIGLVYFLVSARYWALLAGGAAAYLGYAACYPRRRELSGLADPSASPNTTE
jgi:hypothetical protein